MQAQHDPRAQRRGPGPHRHRPHLEQFGRGPLDEGVPPVAAAGGGANRGRGAAAAHRDAPATVGAQVPAGPPGAVSLVQVGHGDRVRRLEAAQRLRAVPGGLPVHGAQHRDLGGGPVHPQLLRHRGVEVVGHGRGGQGAVPRHRGEHPRLDLAQVSPDEDVPGFGHDRPAHYGRHVVQATGGRHPAGRAVGAGPRAAQPAVGPEMGVQPPVAVRGGDPFRLAPLQQRRDQRVSVAERAQPPRPGVGNVHPGLGQQEAHLRRAAQVGGRARRRVPQHLRVARGPVPGRLGPGARARAHERGQDLLGDGPVHRQPVGRQLRAQQFGGGFGLRRGHGHRPVRQPGQRLLLKPGGGQGQLRPAGHPFGTGRPAAADPAGPQVAAGLHRLGGITGLTRLEQVRLAGRRARRRGQVMQVRPHPAGVGPPPAEQQPVYRTDVPAGRQAHVPGRQHRGRFAGPDRPPGPQLRVDEPEGAVAAGGRHGPPPARGRQPQVLARFRARGQSDQVPALYPRPAELR